MKISLKNNEILSSLLLIVAFVLEALPIGIAVYFAPSPDERLMKLFSYFDLYLWGGAAMVTPFFTAVSTCAAIILLTVLVFKKKRAIAISAFATAAAATVFSVMHVLFFGIAHYTIAGLIVTILLGAAAFLLVPTVVSIARKDAT